MDDNETATTSNEESGNDSSKDEMGAALATVWVAVCEATGNDPETATPEEVFEQAKKQSK